MFKITNILTSPVAWNQVPSDCYHLFPSSKYDGLMPTGNPRKCVFVEGKSNLNVIN